MLCVLAVFLPALFMAGVGRQLFVPLSLAVGFAMLASYFISSTLVPVMSTWMLRPGPRRTRFFERLRSSYATRPRTGCCASDGSLVGVYIVAAAVLDCHVVAVDRNGGLSAYRNATASAPLRAPTGTRLERTELIALKAMDVIKGRGRTEQRRDYDRVHRRAVAELPDQYDLPVHQRSARSRPWRRSEAVGAGCDRRLKEGCAKT